MQVANSPINQPMSNEEMPMPACSNLNDPKGFAAFLQPATWHGSTRAFNMFAGVLKFKRQSEQLLEQSGLPFTILRPGRLTDGPYTSYDLNTLLKATSGSRKDIQLSPRDDQQGEASRIAVAGAALPSGHGIKPLTFC